MKKDYVPHSEVAAIISSLKAVHEKQTRHCIMHAYTTLRDWSQSWELTLRNAHGSVTMPLPSSPKKLVAMHIGLDPLPGKGGLTLILPIRAPSP